jgi:hypothetical protein
MSLNHPQAATMPLVWVARKENKDQSGNVAWNEIAAGAAAPRIK